MESKVKYTIVGIFVFTVGFLLAAFIFWMGKYGSQSAEHDWYRVLMKDSVSGLNKESPVKFRGVEVGQVQTIKINKDNSEEVEILIRVEKNTPIKKDSVAILSSLGITGLSYIELKGGSNASERLISSKSEPSIIKSEASLFSRLENSAFGMTDRMEDTLKRVQILMDDKNLNNFQNILTNLNELTVVLNSRTNRLLSEDNVNKITHVVERLDKISSAIDEKQIVTLLKSTEETEKKAIILLATLDSTVREFNTTLSRGDYNFEQMTAQSRTLVNDVLFQMKTLGYDMKEVLQQLKRSPSDIFFKSQTRELGPGE